MKTIKAAAVQLSPVLYSREGTVEKVVRKPLLLAKELRAAFKSFRGNKATALNR